MTNKKDQQEITKKNYEEFNEWHAEKSKTHSWVPQIERFISKLADGAKILDVGAGSSGRDIKEFVKHGFIVEALDYSSAAVASLRKTFGTITVHEANMLKTGLPDETYDGIWACASVVNIPKSDVPTALSEFYRILRSGEILFVSVKEGEGERMVPDKGGERFFNFFKEADFKELVANVGFKVSHSELTVGLAGTRWVCIYALK